MRSTYTYALMAVPKKLYAFVRAKMNDAGYQQAIGDEGEIDMRGIALVPDDSDDPSGLNLAELRVINVQRSKRWHADGEPWGVADWSNAMAGEAGEACNAVKKLRRIETGLLKQGKLSLTREEVIAMVAEELADVVLYADLLADHLGIDLSRAIVEKFNLKSAEMGFPEKL